MITRPFLSQTPQSALGAVLGLPWSPAHYGPFSDELFVGSAEPWVTLRIVLEVLLIVAKRWVMLPPALAVLSRCSFYQGWAPDFALCLPISSPGGGADRPAQIAVSASCLELDHLLPATVVGER